MASSLGNTPLNFEHNRISNQLKELKRSPKAGEKLIVKNAGFFDKFSKNVALSDKEQEIKSQIDLAFKEIKALEDKIRNNTTSLTNNNLKEETRTKLKNELSTAIVHLNEYKEDFKIIENEKLLKGKRINLAIQKEHGKDGDLKAVTKKIDNTLKHFGLIPTGKEKQNQNPISLVRQKQEIDIVKNAIKGNNNLSDENKNNFLVQIEKKLNTIYNGLTAENKLTAYQNELTEHMTNSRGYSIDTLIRKYELNMNIISIKSEINPKGLTQEDVKKHNHLENKYDKLLELQTDINKIKSKNLNKSELETILNKTQENLDALKKGISDVNEKKFYADQERIISGLLHKIANKK